MASKAKRLVAGSVLGGGSFIISVFISLFMTPFMINSFGDKIYGLWMLVASFSGFYGMLDLGLSTAVQRYMSRAVGTGDNEEANIVFNTSFIVFCGIGFVAMLLAFIIAFTAPVFVKNPSDISVFRLIIILSSVNIIIGFPMRAFWGILSSNLRYDILVYLDLANVFIKTILIILFLNAGFGVVAVAVINLITDLMWNITNIIYAFKMAPYIRLSFGFIKIKRLRTFFGYSLYVFISRVAEIIKFNIDNYVISTFVGLGAVTVYSIGIRLINYSINLLRKLVGLMTPVFSQYEGQGDFDSIREKYFFVFKIGVYVSIFIGALLFTLSKPFIMRWVGEGYDESSKIVLIFVVPVVFRMIMTSSDQLLYGISKHKFLTWVNSVEALSNLILSLIFVRIWGIKGVALGTAIPMVLAKAFIQPAYTAHVLGVSAWNFYSKMFIAIAKSLFVMAALYFITKNIIAVSFLRLIAIGIIQTICYGAIIFKIGLTAPEQRQLIKGFTPKWALRTKKTDNK